MAPRRPIAARLLALAVVTCAGAQLPSGELPTPVDERLTFERDVMPVLTAAGCNAGACHGKQRGQNGFQLSLLGFDADFDYAAIVSESRGRRVSPAAPESSLLLRKPAMAEPHGGGLRLDPEGEWYALLRRWIVQGMPRRAATDPVLVEVEIGPAERFLEPAQELELLVTAKYSDGSTRDVTRVSAYQSNEPAIVAVVGAGRLRAGRLPGEATIMARYMNHIATWNTAIPRAEEAIGMDYAALPRRNEIDRLVWEKLAQLRIVPSAVCDDATYLRRAHLDIIGRLPTPDEVRAFLADSDPAKRDALVDRLLARPEYADHWANKWGDLLRPNPYRVGIKATLNLDAWLRAAFRQNLRYDTFVRELVCAEGSTWRNGAAVLHRDRREPEEIAPLISQLFLGIRLECAKCHHHPFEVWGQDDFYGLAAYFARVGRKGGGLSPPISGDEEIIFTAESGAVAHPISGASVAPKPLFGKAREPQADEDPRQALADWLIADDEGYFSQAAANRIWAEMLGRGIVDPVDDLRATNPPSNAPLLAALAEELRRAGYDQKQLIRWIAQSHVYQLDSLPSVNGSGDSRNFSRHYRQRLRAEVLLDAVSDVTGVPERFEAMPPGSRAMELWTARIDSVFLDAFGRPDANQDPPCERTHESTVVQSLHLMNSAEVHAKVTADSGRANQLAQSDRSARQIVEELYLACYGRWPEDDEVAALEPMFGATPEDRRRAAEDVLWALLNSPEFLFKD